MGVMDGRSVKGVKGVTDVKLCHGCKSVKGFQWYQGRSWVSRYVKVLRCQVSRGVRDARCVRGVRDVKGC